MNRKFLEVGEEIILAITIISFAVLILFIKVIRELFIYLPDKTKEVTKYE